MKPVIPPVDRASLLEELASLVRVRTTRRG